MKDSQENPSYKLTEVSLYTAISYNYWVSSIVTSIIKNESIIIV